MKIAIYILLVEDFCHFENFTLPVYKRVELKNMSVLLFLGMLKSSLISSALDLAKSLTLIYGTVFVLYLISPQKNPSVNRNTIQ